MELILASTSKFRQKLLQDFDIPFTAVKPDFDEDQYKDYPMSVTHLCEVLAEGKAKSLKAQYPNSIIVGSDQMACLGDRIIGKAGTKEKAVEQLYLMQGETHLLVTAMCVLTPVKKYLYTDVTKMTMKSLTRSQIEKYVSHDETWDCAGSYKLEKSGRALFSSIECKDETAIIGLPMMALNDILMKENFELPYI